MGQRSAWTQAQRTNSTWLIINSRKTFYRKLKVTATGPILIEALLAQVNLTWTRSPSATASHLTETRTWTFTASSSTPSRILARKRRLARWSTLLHAVPISVCLPLPRVQKASTRETWIRAVSQAIGRKKVCWLMQTSRVPCSTRPLIHMPSLPSRSSRSQALAIKVPTAEQNRKVSTAQIWINLFNIQIWKNLLIFEFCILSNVSFVTNSDAAGSVNLKLQ